MRRSLLVLASTLGIAGTVVGLTGAATLPPAPIFAAPAMIAAAPTDFVTVGDVDSNGAPDLVAASGNTGSVSVNLGDGDGTFQPMRYYVGGTSVADVAVGTLNADAFPDIAVASMFENGVRVLPGPFPEPNPPDFPEDVPGATLYPTGQLPRAVAIADIDHVGHDDLVVGNAGDNTVSVLLANTSGGFAPKVDYPSGPQIAGATALAVANVGGSGDLDIVVANYESNTVSVLLGNNDGTFQPRTSFGSDDLFEPVSIALGRLNGDLALDLVVGQANGAGLDVFLGNGDGTFAAQSANLLPLEAREAWVASLEIADLNFDGHAEVVLGIAGTGAAGEPSRVAALVGRGDGTFTELVDYLVGGAAPFSTAVADLNNDQRPDLAASENGLWAIFNRTGPITAEGSTVVVVPVDAESGRSPVTITFADVTQAGSTTLDLVEETDPNQIFLDTTAQFASAELCFSYTPPAVPTVVRFDQAAAVWRMPAQTDTGTAVCVDVTDIADFRGPWASVLTSGPQTPLGSGIVVNPLDPTTGATPVTITFANVTAVGATNVTSSSTGPALPSGFALASTYYALTTTAAFDSAEVCFRYSGSPRPSIVHWVGGVPRLEPTSRDTGTEVCAVVTSFSPFALVVPVGGADTDSPVVTCGSADGAWHGANVSIACTAQDAGSGLANPADAAFSLSTAVAAGTEDGDAATGTRQVCDAVGNCATAGPIAGNKVDRKAPALSLPAARTVDATSPAGAAVTYAASATDGAHPSPTVSCAPATGSVFAIGTTTVACTAADHVGNTAGGSFTVTVRGAKEQLARLVNDVVAASALPAAVKTQLLAKLQPLVAGFDPGNPAQRKAVCTGLSLFTAVLRLLSGHGVPPAQATAWVADANRIRAVLGC